MLLCLNINKSVRLTRTPPIITIFNLLYLISYLSIRSWTFIIQKKIQPKNFWLHMSFSMTERCCEFTVTKKRENVLFDFSGMSTWQILVILFQKKLKIKNTPMCQELLALTAAFNAALPTGHLGCGYFFCIVRRQKLKIKIEL